MNDIGTLDTFIVGQTLGRGAQAKVKVARDANGQQYALKIFDLANPLFTERSWNNLIKEVNAMSQLQHPNIVRSYNFSASSVLQKYNGKQINVAYIALEKIDGLELFDYIAQTGPMSEEVCRYFFK